MRLEVSIEKRLGAFLLKSEFAVEQETFALLGASGCGKTMTLKCIAGIEKPDRGRIVLGDRVLFDSKEKINLPARERRVGYLFQEYALFPHMTVRQNITCATKDRDYADELIRRFCIQDIQNQYPAELSGGQSQRTALARMLATKPEVLLLDEPFSALDNYMRTRMEHVILDLLEEYQGPSILVTHDRNEAYRMAQRIGVMEAGTIVEQKEKRAFFDHPGSVAAARLTGCKNISRIHKKEDGTWFAEDWGLTLAAPLQGEKALKEARIDEVTHVGYRAHYFQYVEDKTDDDAMEEVLHKPCDRFSCQLERVIEDTFSVVICFTVQGNLSESPDALMTWVVDMAKWTKVKERVLTGSFCLRMDPERLLFLAEA